jgi:hypothetical protein
MSAKRAGLGAIKSGGSGQSETPPPLAFPCRAGEGKASACAGCFAQSGIVQNDAKHRQFRRSDIPVRHRAVENAPSPDERPDVGQVCPTYALLSGEAKGEYVWSSSDCF